jgi:hypothetical protein
VQPPQGSYRTGGVIRNGITLRVACNQACLVKGSMLVSPAAAGRLGLPSKHLSIGAGSTSLRRAGTTKLKLVLSLTGASSQKLQLERQLLVTLRIVVQPAVGGPGVKTSPKTTLKP